MASRSSITQAYDQLILGHPAEQTSQARSCWNKSIPGDSLVIKIRSICHEETNSTGATLKLGEEVWHTSSHEVLEPRKGMLQDLLCSRAIILKAATDTLLNPTQRRVFDETDMLEVPHNDLPGVRLKILKHTSQISSCNCLLCHCML